jgi:tetratricopeptide (TPR) repeat protein
MKNTIPYVLILLVLPFKFFSQKFDEKTFLKGLAKARNDSNKVNSLNFYGGYLNEKENYEKAAFYSDSACKLARRIKFDRGEMEAYGHLRMAYYKSGDLESTVHTERKKLNKYQQSKNLPGIAHTHQAIGILFSELNQSDSAIHYCQKALNGFKPINDKHGIALSASFLGSLCLHKKNFGKALAYSKDAMHMFEELNDKRALAEIYANLVEIYGEIGNSPEQKHYETKLNGLKKEVTAINNTEETAK